MIASIFLPLFLFFQATPAQVAPTSVPRPMETPRAAEVKDEPPILTKHSIRAGTRQLNYTVTTGFMPLKNAVSGDTEARMFCVSAIHLSLPS